MDANVLKIIKRHLFLEASILLHLIFLLLFCLMITKQGKVEKRPAIYVPAFVYGNNMPLPASSAREEPEKQQSASSKEDSMKKVTDDFAIKLPSPQLNFSKAQTSSPPTTMQPITLSASNKESEPVHLLGDELRDDPFRKLLGIAITRHLIYPRVAQELNIRGIVTIGFFLHPDGDVTHIKLMKSSHEQMLDEAALYAVSHMSPVNNVNIYLDKARFLVINIIFR